MHRYLQSVLFIDCFFFDGFEITLMCSDRNDPMSMLLKMYVFKTHSRYRDNC